MANTDVVIRDEMGLRIPSVSKVTVNSSDSVTFTVEDDANTSLYFSPETASILSPKPGARVELAFGQTLIYSFTTPGNGSYGVITQAPEDPVPESFDFGSASVPPSLVIQPGQGTNFPGPRNSPQG